MVCCHLNLDIQIFNREGIRTPGRQFQFLRNTVTGSRKTDSLKAHFEENAINFCPSKTLPAATDTVADKLKFNMKATGLALVDYSK